jgi:hypothetical protein
MTAQYGKCIPIRRKATVSSMISIGFETLMILGPDPKSMCPANLPDIA